MNMDHFKNRNHNGNEHTHLQLSNVDHGVIRMLKNLQMLKQNVKKEIDVGIALNFSHTLIINAT